MKIKKFIDPREERMHYLYFITQKLIGVVLLILTTVVCKLLDGDATIALVTVPLGCYLLFTKEKLWIGEWR